MKRLALYPFLFVLYAISTPLANNLDQLNPVLALRPLIVLCLAAAGGLLLFYILFRDWRYAGYLVFLVTLYFVAFGHLNRFIQDQLPMVGKTLDELTLLAICTFLLVLFAIKGIWIRIGGRAWLAPFLNLVMAIGLIFSVFGLSSGFINEPVQARNVTSNPQNNF